MAFSSAFSRAFVLALPVYIAPMRAQRALYDGAEESFAGGVLKIGGRVLIGLSGRPYAFVSADTAARWCAAGRRVAKQADGAKREALIDEAVWCEMKWAAYE